MLAAAGAEDPAATLRPLLSAALDNALQHGDAALTGPIVRGDVHTVDAHLHDIEAGAPQALTSYVALARATLARSVTDGRLAAHPRPPDPRAPRRGVPSRPSGRRGRPARRQGRPGRPTVSGAPVLASTREELAGLLADARRAGRQVGLVPTMGALHEGHASLLREARRRVGDGPVVASVFVNPLQFGPGEDLERYPRTLEADLEVCAREGVDVVLAPAVRRDVPRLARASRAGGGHRPRPRGRRPRGPHPTGPLPGRLRGGGQAVRPGPPGRGGLRAEGLPAAGRRPPDGRRPLPRRRRGRRRDGARARRAGAAPAATGSSTPSSVGTRSC